MCHLLGIHRKTLIPDEPMGGGVCSARLSTCVPSSMREGGTEILAEGQKLLEVQEGLCSQVPCTFYHNNLQLNSDFNVYWF